MVLSVFVLFELPLSPPCHFTAVYVCPPLQAALILEHSGCLAVHNQLDVL